MCASWQIYYKCTFISNGAIGNYNILAILLCWCFGEWNTMILTLQCTSWNKSQFFLKCWQSLIANSIYFSYELHVWMEKRILCFKVLSPCTINMTIQLKIHIVGVLVLYGVLRASFCLVMQSSVKCFGSHVLTDGIFWWAVINCGIFIIPAGSHTLDEKDQLFHWDFVACRYW